MPIFGSAASSQKPESALRLPAQKRISAPTSQRLSTITEGANAGANTNQPRGILRSSIPDSTLRPTYERQTSGATSQRQSQDTQRTAPPAYTWIPEPVDADEDLTAPVEGEKLAQLRQAGGHIRKKRTRGGWGRLILITGLVLLIIIALAVGLGVGLTGGKNHNSNGEGESEGQPSQPASTTPSTEQSQQFPLGEYSMVTALRTVSTNCTSNPSTWRCYPYTTYDRSDSSTNTSSLASFNWIISNTNTSYATNETSPTSDQGVPANLTISSTSNPFSITFSNQALTYISTSTNTTSPRYTFTFPMHKSVIPSTSLTSSGAASECFFNSTTFTGTLYLAAPRTYPDASLTDSTAVGGYAQWPYAIEIQQESPGGEDVPACYEMANGQVEDRILTAVTPEAVGERCVCGYRNF